MMRWAGHGAANSRQVTGPVGILEGFPLPQTASRPRAWPRTGGAESGVPNRQAKNCPVVPSHLTRVLPLVRLRGRSLVPIETKLHLPHLLRLRNSIRLVRHLNLPPVVRETTTFHLLLPQGISLLLGGRRGNSSHTPPPLPGGQRARAARQGQLLQSPTVTMETERGRSHYDRR